MVLSGVALYASLFADSIRQNGLFQVAFWLGIFVGLGSQIRFGILADRAALESEGKLSTANTKLETLEQNLASQVEKLSTIPTMIRTQPPDDFLLKYAVAMDANLEIVIKVVNDQEAGTQAATEAITTALKWLANLAAAFDSDPGSTVRGEFSANIMLFVPKDELGTWASRLKFEKGLQPDRFRGALVLRSGLAVDQKGDEVSTEDFALLVPHKPSLEVDGRLLWEALPGAPLAAARRDFELVTAPKEMGAWIRKNTNFTPSIASDVESYFRASTMAGFISMPIWVPSTDPDQLGDVLGVVNIEWTQARLLTVPEGAASFHKQLKPMLSLLALLVRQAGAELLNPHSHRS